MGENQQQQIQIRIPDGLRSGTYANHLVLSHTDHEFTLDFCAVLAHEDPSIRQAEVVARVVVAPTLVGTLLTALNDNLGKYERQFGEVRRP